MTAQVSGARLVSRRSLVGSSILVAENVLRLGLVAAVSMWIAHELGPAEFGLLNHASALVAVVAAAATLGMDTPLTARLTVHAQPGRVLGSAVVLRLAVGLLAVGIAACAALLLRGGESKALLLTVIVALSVPLSAPFVIDAWFKSHNEALPPALARLVATVLSCSAKAAVLLLGGGVVALAWTVAIEAALLATALVVVYGLRRPSGEPARLSVRRDQMGSLLAESWPFLLSTFAIAAYMKVDVVLLGALSNDQQTGLYSLSQKLAEVLYLVPVIVADVLFPQLVRQHAAHEAHAGAGEQSYFDLSFATAALATAAAIVLVVLFVPALFGEPYRPTVGIFVIHAWACLGIALNYARYKWMAATGLQSLAPWVALLGLALAVAGHAALIPRYGATGAAVATVAAFFASGYLSSFLFPALRPVARLQTRALWPWGRLWQDWQMWRASVAARSAGR